MSYYNIDETNARIAKIRRILKEKNLDAALIYYDQLNIADGWCLTGWCPQFEKGAILLPLEGEPVLLGGPECASFAKMSSAIPTLYCFSAFMVPEEEYPNATIYTFERLFNELAAKGITFKRVGVVGIDYFPYATYVQFQQGFNGVEMIDITDEYDALRYIKSPWEIQNVKKAFSLTWDAYNAMKKKIAPGVTDTEVAAEGEYACRTKGANNFAFECMVGSGEISNAVAPVATNRIMQPGEMVMIGIAPRWYGYAGVMGDTLPVSGEYTQEQKDVMNVIREVYRKTRDAIAAGKCGRDIDKIGAAIYAKHDWTKYIVCPFLHTIGLMEAERPFFGPNGDDELKPGMTLSVDISIFNHPVHHGVRVETGFLLTENGVEALSPEMDAYLSQEL